MDALAKGLKRIGAAKDTVRAGAKGFHHRVPFQGVEQDNDFYVGMMFAHLTEQTTRGKLLICHATDQSHLKSTVDENLEQVAWCDCGNSLEALAALQCVRQ
jgi:hypothetical protein